MKDSDVFWKLEGLSDRELLERLGSMLGSSRRLMAALVAHLGEVEERRLHLAAACSSMFAYCLKLGMTEDEAYRRIEVARLARRYPAIFPLLADGQLTISVVALLKHYLSDENHVELLGRVAGKSVGQTRELIAARFPRPDVASSVRKLPERRLQQPLAMATLSAPCAAVTAPGTDVTKPRFTSSGADSLDTSGHPEPTELACPRASMSGHPALEAPVANRPAPPAHSEGTAPSRSRIEPLSAQRYKVQLTATADLARKLELARDLMRHSHPDGELGPIVERALDLLIESLMRRRFGKSKKASPRRTSARARHADTEHGAAVMRSTMRGTAGPATLGITEPNAGCANTSLGITDPNVEAATALSNRTRDTTALVSAEVPGEQGRARTELASSAYIPRATRRRVVERDGLGCSWVDERGVRCGSRAWLEYDHHHPRAKGGGSEPANLRLLCRNHNQFAAEHEYGRKHVDRTIAERRRKRRDHGAKQAQP